MPEDQPKWYQSVNDDGILMQGDLIYGCPYIIPPTEVSVGARIEANVIAYDVIILTQSCDLEKDNLELVLVCPFWPLKEIEEKIPQLKDDNLKESAKRGYQPAWVILDALGEKGFLVVDFRYTYSVPIETLKALITQNPSRWRLNSPYREHLSQEFAKFFMRVGLPIGIPHFSRFTINYCRKCPVNHSVRE